MATEKSESEKLKAQIKYLTDLINNAKNYGHVEHVNSRTKAIARPLLHSTKWTEQSAPVQSSKRKDLPSFYQTKSSSFPPSPKKSKYSYVSGTSSQQSSQQAFNAAKPNNFVAVDFQKTVNHQPSHITRSASLFHWKASKSQQDQSVNLSNKKSSQIQASVPKKEDKNQDVPHITSVPSDKLQVITTSLQNTRSGTGGSKKTAVVRKTTSLVDPKCKMVKSSFLVSMASHIPNSTTKPVSTNSEKSVSLLKKQYVNSSSQKMTEIKGTKPALDTERQKMSEITGAKAALKTERQKMSEITGAKAALDTERQKMSEITGAKAALDTERQKMSEITGAKAVLETERQKMSEIAGTKPALDTERQKMSEITGAKAALETERQKMTEITGAKAVLETERQKMTEIAGTKASLETERQKMTEITGTKAALETERQKMTADSTEHLSPLKESPSVISQTESSKKKKVDKLRQELLETEVRMITLKNLISEQKDKVDKMSPTKSPVHQVFHKHILNNEKTRLTSSPFASNSSDSKRAKTGFRKEESTENFLTNVLSDSSVSNQTNSEKTKGLNSIRTRFKILNKGNNQGRTDTHGNIEKKVLKTRYSIRKISSNSESTGSNKKRTGSILVTKYKLRRSFSNNPETLPTRDTSSTIVRRRSSSDTSHTQLIAKTIRSKYKLKKVLVERPKVSSPKCSPRSVHYHASRMIWTPRKQRNGQTESTWKGKLKSHYIGAYKYHLGYKSFGTRAGQVYQGHSAGSRARSWQPSYVLQRRQQQDYINIRNVASKVQYLKEHIPFNPRLRIDRRKQERKEIPQTGALSVSTNKMVYRSGSKKLRLRNQIIAKNVKSTCTKIFTISGVKFKMDTSGKSLQRISPVKVGPILYASIDGMPPNPCFKDAESSSVRPQRSSVSRVGIGGITYIQTKPGTLEIDSSVKTRALASQVVHKSLMTAMAAKYKKNNIFKLTAKRYCKFYNRFGKCNRGDNCPYIHDPDKIVVCTRFLRGTCKVTDCPFSHKISKEKMPVCSYFLRGVCNRDDCPYQHVNVGKDAQICQDFVNGYCPLGEKCKKRHILVCPYFSRTGSCPDGKKCKLVHRRPKKRANSSLSGKESTARKKPHLSPEESSSKVTEGTSETDGDDVDLPFRERQLPSFISLGDTSIEDLSFATIPIKEDKPVPSVRIRPQF